MSYIKNWSGYSGVWRKRMESKTQKIPRNNHSYILNNYLKRRPKSILKYFLSSAIKLYY